MPEFYSLWQSFCKRKKKEKQPDPINIFNNVLVMLLIHCKITKESAQ